jgi:hypothetical protein
MRRETGGSWWVDEPIGGVESDLLDRGTFVAQVRGLIDQVGASAGSTVIGLVGPWGSGKTSTVNMILADLDESHWSVVHVTPWALTGADAVVAELLAGIVTALEKAGEKTSKVRTALRKYGTFVTPLLSAVPGVGDVAKGMAEAALTRLDHTVQQHVEEVAEQLKELARPVLVVVDDIDRLQHQELLALFRGVRVLGRLPHVHYLLAYDEQTVLDVLQATEIAKKDKARAFAFLEKIVSLRLDQPPTRPEQAEEMLADGLGKVIADHVGRLSEDQRIRLDDEREALMSAILTEPRAISRYLTQLRTYLPIVGATEIDFVDYAVITLLRMTYPDLVKALFLDKAALVGAGGPPGEQRLIDWGTAAEIKRHGVSADHLSRVVGAIQRLFPRTAPKDRAVHVLARDSLRKGRRASDPDYVDRYFALTALTGDLADAGIAAALHEWFTGQPGDADREFTQRLNPSPADKAACGRAARLIRRASSHSEDLDAAAASGVLRSLLSRLPMSPDSGIESATIGWIAVLLPKALQLEPEQIVELLERPPEHVSPLSYLLRAFRVVSWPSASAGERWLSRVSNLAINAAWRRFLEHVRLGDAAPQEPVGQLLSWLENAVTPAAFRQALATSVDDGLPLPDLIARMVEIGVDPAGQATRILPLDLSALVFRLGPQRIYQHRDELRAATSGNSIDLEDVSWSNRKAAAATELLAAADQQRLIRLPDLPTIETPATLLSHEPDLIGRWRGGETPDLTAQLTVLVPDGSTAPGSADARRGPVGDQREEGTLQLLAGAPIVSWLDRTRESWHLAVGDWDLTDAQARSSTTAVLTLDVDGGSERPHRQLPIHVAAQVRTGPNQSGHEGPDPVLMLTIVVALWLSDLSEDRLPGDERQSERPLPAALSLTELVELVAALLSSVSTAFLAHDLLVETSPPPAGATVDLKLHTGDRLGAAIDLSSLRTIGEVTRLDHRSTIELDRTARTYDENLLGLAAATVNEWLLNAGYRGQEPNLLTILQNHYD